MIDGIIANDADHVPFTPQCQGKCYHIWIGILRPLAVVDNLTGNGHHVPHVVRVCVLRVPDAPAHACCPDPGTSGCAISLSSLIT